LANHVIDDATGLFNTQHQFHKFEPFITCQREVITDGESKFRIKVEFEPDPIESLALLVAQN